MSAHCHLSGPDLIATFTELTAKQIALACKRFNPSPTDDVILRGGIAANSYFMERMTAQMTEQTGVVVERIKTLDELGIDEDSWENAMYALFGYLCFNGIYNFVPSCTGAAARVVGGKIAPGSNYASLHQRFNVR